MWCVTWAKSQRQPEAEDPVSEAAVKPSEEKPGEGTEVPDDIDIHTTAGKGEDLSRRLEEAVHAASEKAVEKQHKKGKKTARERVLELLDEDSFVELDELARHRSTAFGMEKNRPYGDGEPGEERQPRPPRDGDRVGSHQQGEGERGARRGDPDTVEPAAAGGLVLGDHHEPGCLTAPRPGGDVGVGGRRGLGHLDPPAGGQQSFGVQRWAAGLVVGHRH